LASLVAMSLKDTKDTSERKRVEKDKKKIEDILNFKELYNEYQI
jgi:hypothetical protein